MQCGLYKILSFLPALKDFFKKGALGGGEVRRVKRKTFPSTDPRGGIISFYKNITELIIINYC